MSIFDWFRRKKPRQTALGSSWASLTGNEEAVLKALQEACLVGTGMVKISHIEDAGRIPLPMTQPPDPMPWAKWLDGMAELSPPDGWAACQFATRIWIKGEEDRASFLFGVARGPFGVYTRHYPVCWHDDETEPAIVVLATLTHLPTGTSLGIFCDRGTACAAADTLLPSKVEVPWEKLHNPTDQSVWNVVTERTKTVWEFNGFAMEEGRHCHGGSNTSGPMFGIWARAPVAEPPTPAVLS
jgi:hypothetical protein